MALFVEKNDAKKTFDFPSVFLQSSEPCEPTCSVCATLSRHRLDASPVVLSNELTGEYKVVPQYAARDYLSKWSPFYEMPSYTAKHFL